MSIAAQVSGNSGQGNFTLARRLQGGEIIYSAWCRLGSPLIGELLARHGFGAVTFDQQHGLFDIGETHAAIAAVHGLRVPPVVRIAIGDYGAASRMLDGGAEAIIAPMISVPEEAQAFVSAVKYPPLGNRSWGPHRALQQSGMSETQYLHAANSTTLAFAMLETRAGIKNAAAILEIPGIDGAFVGPSDLSITFSNGAVQNPTHPEVEAALDIVSAIARNKGKIAGAHCTSAERAADLARRGFQFLGVASDMGMINLAAQATMKILASKQHV